MHKFSLSILLILFLTSCISIPLPKAQPYNEIVIKKGKTRDKIVVINIEGPIFAQRKTSVFGSDVETSVISQIKEQLDLIEQDKYVKAVILRLNTPGGSVTTCDIIYNELMEFKKRTSIPIIAEMADMAASGGVYISQAADKIIAHPTTVTGSIGVIAFTLNLKELFDKLGVKGEAVKSGDKKDMGSIFRPMTPAEKDIYQDVINSMYERFLTVIKTGRKNINEKKLREIADGRIFVAQKALEYGLIDTIGYTKDTIELTEREAGISEATIITYVRPGRYTPNIYANVQNNSITVLNIDTDFFMQKHGACFMYMWQP